LVNDLGFLPRKIFINESVPEEYRAAVRSYFDDLEYDAFDTRDIIFTADGGLCDLSVKNEDTSFRKTTGSSSLYIGPCHYA
jgi:hypothetical protein